MNKVIIEGHLGRDAKVKENQNGTKFITFSMAVNWSRKKNEEITTWYDIISSKPEHTGALAQYLTSGKGVVVVGDLEPSLNQGIDGKYYMNLVVKPDSITFSNTGRRPENNSTNGGNSVTSKSTNNTTASIEAIPDDNMVDMGNVIPSAVSAASSVDNSDVEDDLPF